MKTRLLNLIVASLMAWATQLDAAPLGTDVNYQGYLTDKNGNPVNGQHDLRFELFDAATGGNKIGTDTRAPVAVNKGLFSTNINFGGVFDGKAYWLEVGVRPYLSMNNYDVQSPRVQIRPVPYALYASNADTAITAATATTATTANGVSANAIGGAGLQNNSITANKIASGQVVKSLNGLFDNVTLAAGANVSLTPSGNTLTIAAAGASGWSLTGNAGTTPGVNFLGTTDSQPLELKVNNSRALRLELALSFNSVSVNTIGGYRLNRVFNGAIGATIAGGGEEGRAIQYQSPNEVGGSFGTIGGGSGNVIRYGSYATIAGGADNLGGYDVTQTGDYSRVGGGYANAADGNYAVVPGGFRNWAPGAYSFAAGRQAKATQDGSFVWSLYAQPAYSFSPNRFHVFAENGFSVDYDAQREDGGGAHWAGIGVFPGQTISTWTGAFLEDNGDWHSRNVIAYGVGNEQAYLGGDGFGNDVQIGSLNPTVQNVAAYNPSFGYMNMIVRTLSITGGSDLAEPFQVSESEIPKGAVVVIDENKPGHLCLSKQAYDTRVAGVVSGVNGVQPGIQMSQKGVLEGTQNIALTGRVYVQADAGLDPIKPGDLLTTSSTPGHAMKVADHSRAQGAILGKAMTALGEGKGRVLVLVTLQ